ncbi:MAG: hypothetical protein E6H72_13985 [Betaproteobacteria bacterium]|nr:MAG: hypothetical protein E6H72_13985 [Betaproteobacteria bacterium]
MTKLAAFIAASLLSTVALAQGYPNRPVRVIVPWPPGQATDIAARAVAEKLQQALKQPFIIDNRAGAGGSIGTDAAVIERADIDHAAPAEDALRTRQGLCPDQPGRAGAVRARHAPVVPGDEREGVHRPPARESGQVHVLVFGHRRVGAPHHGALQLDGAGQGAPRALQG